MFIVIGFGRSSSRAPVFFFIVQNHEDVAMKRKHINMLKQWNSRRVIRYNRWFTEGKRDGLSGIYQDLSQIPKLYREAYQNGHIYGALSRAEAVQHPPRAIA